MRTSNREGPIDVGAKGVPLELARWNLDLDGMSHERAGLLQLHHLKVIADYSEGSAQDTELIILRLKISPHLGEIHS